MIYFFYRIEKHLIKLFLIQNLEKIKTYNLLKSSIEFFKLFRFSIHYFFYIKGFKMF